MDSTIYSLLVGLATNGLSSLIGYASSRMGERLTDINESMQRQVDKAQIEQFLNDSLVSLADSIVWKGPPSIEIVALFLRSPDVEAMVRQIFSATFVTMISSANASDHLRSIRDEFVASFKLFSSAYGEAPSSQSDDVTLIFEALLGTCDAALTHAIESDVLAAHEVRSIQRYQLLKDELATIRENLRFLSKVESFDLDATLEFERAYRKQVGYRHSFIVPPNFDNAHKLGLDDLYVGPKLVPDPKRKGELPSRITLRGFLSRAYRAVVLGNPGGGKSTLASKICFDLATLYSEAPFAGRHVTPILVVLKDYGAEKKNRECSILEYIRLKANSDYQVDSPTGAFEYLLLNGRVVVIFDGLDELLDTSYRQEITSDVELFCHRYPSVPVIVTSREVGYEQAPLDSKRFEIFRLAPFDDRQVREYAYKWFKVDSKLPVEHCQERANAFLVESEIVPDLRSNPLMLALMCNIYRGENYTRETVPTYMRSAPQCYLRDGIVVGEYMSPCLSSIISA